MTQSLTDLVRLHQLAKQHHTRFGCWLRGDPQWQSSLLNSLISHFTDQSIFMLGNTELDGVTCVDYRQGQQWLGKECQWLICDLNQGWDANSFNAALGTLVGGGLLLVVGEPCSLNWAARNWLESALGELIQIAPQSICALPNCAEISSVPTYEQQAQAIEGIIKVATGHRKRPFVLTADRGRGKTSALGMAAAQLMPSRTMKIFVTAPALASVEPLFLHAQRKLSHASVKRGHIQSGESSLNFMAPDELLRSQPECDLLLVDEAAALPLPLLKRLVEKYHRIVFSSTIHGYEGCGRGFSLKFQQWLREQRPQMRALHLDQPIRWAAGDALEQWQNRVFLLQSELTELPPSAHNALSFSPLTQEMAVHQPERLAQVFSLLVNAHYQTSPNDLFSLLNDDAMTLFGAYQGDVCVGCVWAVREGELDDALIDAIQRGTRRPKGHLAPVTLANQLGITEAARQSCWRILRIAVHPACQREGIGSQLLQQFIEHYEADYYATSFGVSEDLLPFWLMNGFIPVKFGSHRDQASGCYSILMLLGSRGLSWLEQAQQQFTTHWIFELSDSLQALEPEIIQQLLPLCAPTDKTRQWVELIERYAQGGSNYESVAVWLFAWLMEISSLNLTISPLLISKVLQRKSWGECAEQFQLTGKRQVEQALRDDLSALLSNLHCK
ncbi:tRNA(Met) cytidine acetyltransferase TmcA [Vibrio metoecus]|uniref:tRNA(Met) cytidine acetyltransferase TmcA n=1 Tax=Vibrio metoecus TaxID=1481663 RepID=UPI0001B99C4F|nr:GNAT family N-acetyltransferase [Vibrio metoecus]EEX64874.1 hypothetical protein VCJ_003412 [Vibrio metoecus]